ncbi:aspartyl/asparaginyl beta-hydroxylase domain-containing protein [Steroidobacter sp.]|uniref:aspartyl/asparaginyl beta-hydroxylase domain-containing protein n=1 Tax=Steroidobacter sp. TaxID=1978227 RepID=UPI001A528622|nr:aspartyl/asparaginyl beta-hydroxylase domain-containing protein [Steroidobacter sp.]MBL8271923.1 aspartyl/asparaginyl beta-hydroxylase domain-containing protein [Steroidobacter sp.]
MLIHAATRPLGPVDCAELTRQVLALDESAWAADPQRQVEHDVHAQTQSVLLLSCHGWPEVNVVQCAGWPLLQAAALPVMHEVVAKHYVPGGTLLRAMVVRLPAGARIAKHRDSHPSFAAAHRIHVPLVTNPAVEFVVNGERVPPRAHFGFELNNNVLHQVVNRGQQARIHLIFDYLPPHAAAGHSS